jgi:hypothetical protein
MGTELGKSVFFVVYLHITCLHTNTRAALDFWGSTQLLLWKAICL